MKKLMLICLISCFVQQLVAMIPKTNPMVFGHNRLTLITPTLLRLEYAHNGKFIDAPTMFAYDRTQYLQPSEFSIKQIAVDVYEINTSAVRIVYRADGYPFSTANFSVYYTLNGKEKKFTNRNIKRNNLGGPIETLDRVTAEIPMNEGLLSKDGWYIIDDTRGDLLKDGWLSPRDTRNNIQDQYCFVYGNDYRAALQSLGAISGHVPMTRKYMHGVWYCKYWDYTAQDYLDIIHGYAKHDFPLDNIVFDMAWHTNNATEGTGHNGNLNWTGFSWNHALIPDPKALIDSIHRLGVQVALNDHPHDGLRPHETAYPDFVKSFKTQSQKPLLFNLGDSAYMHRFFEFAHRPAERSGIDFWWLDWQQNYLYPYVQGTNTTSLSWINELYFKDSKQNNRRGCGFSRWAGWGDHRYPIQFSGDAQANWEILTFEVKLTAASGNGGCYYWAHDIGGFRGEHNPELIVRWTQFGALSAALRVHSTKDPKLDRRPWNGKPQEVDALRKMYHLRSMLMPYVYSSVWQTHQTMVPLNRGMYIDYGQQKEAYDNPQEFMFGDLILAAPITHAGVGDSLKADQKVWFPEGDTWFDFFGHQPYKGGQTKMVTHPITTFPMYLKAGWLLPLQPYQTRPATAKLENLVLRVYPSSRDVEGNTYTLYEDDGVSQEYEQGNYALTSLTYQQHGKKAKIIISPTKGSYEGQVKQRAYTLQLPGTRQLTKVKVNGKDVEVGYDQEAACPVVKIPAQPIGHQLEIIYFI